VITSALTAGIEKFVGIKLPYLRHIGATSPRLFYRFLKIFSFANCAKKASKEAIHTAAMVATRAEDCGECVQIGVNIAKRDGLSPELLRALVDGERNALPPHLQRVFDFAKACLTPEGPSEESRQALRRELGEAAVIELAMTIAAARVFPLVKRALGYSVSCSLHRPVL
jgi:alkylhydroperoxidase family enzyme